MNISEIGKTSVDFRQHLENLKKLHPDFPWYPHNSLDNVWIIEKLLTQDRREMFGNVVSPSVIDVGAGDGDMGFLFESLGCLVDMLDNPQTNFNDCRGIRRLRELLHSNVQLIEQDVDFFFRLDRTYDLGMALGILYHLRNPLAFLISLAQHCRKLVLSTRVAKAMAGQVVQNTPVAYLLDAREANADPTCYWIFSEAGLMRALRRSGWTIFDTLSVGYEGESNPTDNDKDERLFVYAERVPNFGELLKHHDF